MTTKASPWQPAPAMARTLRLFLAAVAVVYLVAFLSLAVQVHGLVGSDGILPVAPWLDDVAEQVGGVPWTRLPTLLWLSASDGMLSALVWGGVAASMVAAVGFARGPMLLVCWLGYLSLVAVGREFLSFQWDSLLLETGFLALFVAPWGLRRTAVVPPRLAVWLLRFLTFKLMFSSGITKLTWHDPTWANLTALDYHYWTQPLPTPLAVAAAALPGWLQKLSCLGMFGVELVAPFGVFGPRRARLAAAAALVGFQMMIAATGNYGFFNLLSVVLCLPLLDDRAVDWLRGRLRLPATAGDGQADEVDDGEPALAARARGAAVTAMAAFTVLLAVPNLGETFRWSQPQDSFLTSLRRAAAPFYVHNGYGLFRVMTTTRPEIEIEVSDDGAIWRPLVFRAKPGPLDRRPPWVQPHMPRLDWQMWFAALRAERVLQATGGRAAPEALPSWLLSFARAVLERRQPVLDLLVDESDRPPPRWIRMSLYQYRFASADSPSGDWWQRRPAGTLLPATEWTGGPQ